MVVEKVLNVSAEDFFNEIMKSIIGDIKRQTGKNVHASQIKPKMNYKKKIQGRSSANSEVVVKVLECVPNQVYCSSFTSKIDETVVRYEIIQQGLEKILVRYTENYTLTKKRHGFFDESNYLEKRSEKKALKLLDKIERTILDAAKVKHD